MTADLAITTLQARHGAADEAFLIGDFNRWSIPGTRMCQVQPGLWEVAVPSQWTIGRVAFAFFAWGRLQDIVAVSSGSESADRSTAKQVPTEELCRQWTPAHIFRRAYGAWRAAVGGCRVPPGEGEQP
jgi:hypothetical protein